METVVSDQVVSIASKNVESVKLFLGDESITVPVRIHRVRSYILSFDELFAEINRRRNKLYSRYFQLVASSFAKRRYPRWHLEIEASSLQALQQLEVDEQLAKEDYDATVQLFTEFVQSQRERLILECANLRLFR